MLDQLHRLLGLTRVVPLDAEIRRDLLPMTFAQHESIVEQLDKLERLVGWLNRPRLGHLRSHEAERLIAALKAANRELPDLFKDPA